MRESDEVRIRALLYRLRYLRAPERWALASRLAEAVESGALTQDAAYRVLMREIPAYAYFACRSGHAYSVAIYRAALRRTAAEMGLNDRQTLALLDMVESRDGGKMTELDVRRYTAEVTR
jgi:hypothetical protein